MSSMRQVDFVRKGLKHKMLAEIPGEVHVSQFSLGMELGEYYFPQVHVMILSLVDSKCTYVQDFSKSNKCFFAMCLWILTWIYSSFWANMYIFTPLGSILFKFFHHLLETLIYAEENHSIVVTGEFSISD